MRYVLGPNDVLRPGEQIHSGCHRFALAMQTDGILALFRYDRRLNDPIAMWHMGVGDGDSKWFAVMRPWGSLCLNDGTSDRYRWPFREFPEDAPAEEHGGRVAIDNDGNLVCYYETPVNGIVWYCQTHTIVSQADQYHCVIPGALSVELGGGVFSQRGDRGIINKTGEFVGIRDAQEYRPVPPEDRVVVAAPGQLVFSRTTFFGKSLDSNRRAPEPPPEVFPPEKKEIFIEKRGNDFFLR